MAFFIVLAPSEAQHQIEPTANCYNFIATAESNDRFAILNENIKENQWILRNKNVEINRISTSIVTHQESKRNQILCTRVNTVLIVICKS